MADWRGALAAKESGFAMGQKTGGKLSSVGIALKNVAEKMKTKEATATALETLGQTEQIKAMYDPQEYKPKTQEEALEFERVKAGIKKQPQAIVDKFGNPILDEAGQPRTRPHGSIFQPAPTLDEIVAQLGKDKLPGIKVNQPQATGNRVSVISPDGKRGNIPTSQLQEALQAGYKRTL